MTARLIGRTGKVRGTEAVVSELFTLGSGAGNDLRIESRTISRKHAQILRVGTDFYLEDLDSRNGTFLNGQRVKRFVIRHLDVLSLGPDVDLIFLETGAAAPVAPRPTAIRAMITWLDGPLAGHSEEIAAGRGLILGRRDDLPLPAVSRRHAALTIAGNRVAIEDLGSANGTSVNGERISTVKVLADGDEVSLGELVRCRISLPAAEPAVVASGSDADEQLTVVVDVPSGRGIEPLKIPHPLAVPTGNVRRPVLQAPPSPEPTATPIGPVPPLAEGVALPSPPAPPADVTVSGPREPAAPPAQVGREDDVPPATPPRDGTIVAPRAPAVLPSFGAPAVPKEGDTFMPPKEAAVGVPSALASRARAARVAADGTIDAPAAAKAATGDARAAEAAAPPAAGIRRVRLDGPGGIEFPHGSYTVGRLPDSDLHLDVRDVGRRHAHLMVSESGLTVEDLSSANGTFVDDALVSGALLVPEGARLRFATVEFSVTYLRTEE